jgi:hypothetical protein
MTVLVIIVSKTNSKDRQKTEEVEQVLKHVDPSTNTKAILGQWLALFGVLGSFL